MARRFYDLINFNAQKPILKALNKRLEDTPKAMRKGARRAINRTLTTARKETSKAIRADLALRAGDIKDRIEKKMVFDLEGKLVVRDRRLELIKFRTPRQTKLTRRRGAARGGVKVTIYKRKGRQLIPGAFIAKGIKSGREHVMKREGSERYPVKILYGPSITKTANRHLPEILKRTEPVFAKNLDREIQFALSKL